MSPIEGYSKYDFKEGVYFRKGIQNLEHGLFDTPNIITKNKICDPKTFDSIVFSTLIEIFSNIFMFPSSVWSSSIS